MTKRVVVSNVSDGGGSAALADGDYGDIVVSSSGTVFSIDAGVIVNADVNASAAIDWSKISKTGSSLADLTTRSASDLSSGTVATARLGSGTANSTTFLRGDQSWATPSTLFTVAELDGNPTSSSINSLQFPQGTVTILSNVATISNIIVNGDQAWIGGSASGTLEFDSVTFDPGSGDIDKMTLEIRTTCQDPAYPDNFITFDPENYTAIGHGDCYIRVVADLGSGQSYSISHPTEFRAAAGLVIGTNVQAYDADLASWAGVTRASGFDTFAATPSSANLRSLVTDETGSSGSLVFAGGPTLTGTTTVATVSFGTSTLVQGSSNVLEQRNGTNAQTQIIYGTYTDSSNYVGLSLASSSTATTISAVTAGTGADNVNITVQPAGTGSLVTGSTSSTGTRLLVSSQYLENNVLEVRSGSGSAGINASQLNASFLITASADTGIGRFVCWNQNGLEVNAYQWDDARGMGFTLTENIFNIRNPSAPGRSPYCQASFSAWSSTSPNQSLATIVNTWVDSTHASRKARTVFNTYDTAAREALRLEASGSAAKIGFLGASAIVKPTTGSGAATFAANTSGIANDTATFDGYTIGQVVKALRDFGLLT